MTDITAQLREERNTLARALVGFAVNGIKIFEPNSEPKVASCREAMALLDSVLHKAAAAHATSLEAGRALVWAKAEAQSLRLRVRELEAAAAAPKPRRTRKKAAEAA